jgi:hypothetical protein
MLVNAYYTGDRRCRVCAIPGHKWQQGGKLPAAW